MCMGRLQIWNCRWFSRQYQQKAVTSVRTDDDLSQWVCKRCVNNLNKFFHYVCWYICLRATNFRNGHRHMDCEYLLYIYPLIFHQGKTLRKTTLNFRSTELEFQDGISKILACMSIDLPSDHLDCWSLQHSPRGPLERCCSPRIYWLKVVVRIVLSVWGGEVSTFSPTSIIDRNGRSWPLSPPATGCCCSQGTLS